MTTPEEHWASLTGDELAVRLRKELRHWSLPPIWGAGILRAADVIEQQAREIDEQAQEIEELRETVRERTL